MLPERLIREIYEGKKVERAGWLQLDTPMAYEASLTEKSKTSYYLFAEFLAQ